MKLNESGMARALRDVERAVILTHRRPDGDTVGCAAALCLGLRQLGKDAVALENPELTEKYRPYLEGLLCDAIGPERTIIAVDVAAEDMFAKGLVLPRQIDLAIDHHASNSGYARESLVRSDRAACGEIVFDVLCELGVALTVSIAEALYVAVSTDTGCFRHSNVTANTFRVAAALLEAGVDAYPINRRMFELKRFARLKLDAYLTETMRFYAGGRIGVCLIPADIRERLGLTEDDVDDISGFARMIEGVELAAMLRQMPGSVKLSLRSGRLYDSGAICLRLGGGGHFSAAGATLHPDPVEAERQLLEAIYALYPELSCPAE